MEGASGVEWASGVELASCQFQYIFGRAGCPLYSYSFLNSAHLTQLLVGKNPLLLVTILDHRILPTLRTVPCSLFPKPNHQLVGKN
ncbi:MAG: hypothetical protein F6K26_16280 [Moorea sp. SIO2I5]|nr:hypothetical protein [Moorena sp. SIO2I5]